MDFSRYAKISVNVKPSRYVHLRIMLYFLVVIIISFNGLFVAVLRPLFVLLVVLFKQYLDIHVGLVP